MRPTQRRSCMTSISAIDAIRSQRAIREFSDEPVSEEAVTQLIQAAIRAPSASNKQPWHFLVVRDAEAKRKIGLWYMDSVYSYSGQERPSDGITEPHPIMSAPVLIFACIDAVDVADRLTLGASIFPAAQNLMLAARSMGLGTTLTTLHRPHQDEIRALLGIPESVETAALIPVGYPGGDQHFGGSRRRPAKELTYYERWGATK
ncbi:MAG: hypothetical protein FI707_06665 [SAR202 cluster bacterium]|nr:hypothetical protein [Chloroflexota bacterium]MQG58493.1 hypothetical protein [SAR202 cluster bacterium]MQG68456.1 hypothetical protein [SAR202 cluster bacterium]